MQASTSHGSHARHECLAYRNHSMSPIPPLALPTTQPHSPAAPHTVARLRITSMKDASDGGHLSSPGSSRRLSQDARRGTSRLIKRGSNVTVNRHARSSQSCRRWHLARSPCQQDGGNEHGDRVGCGQVGLHAAAQGLDILLACKERDRGAIVDANNQIAMAVSLSTSNPSPPLPGPPGQRNVPCYPSAMHRCKVASMPLKPRVPRQHTP